MKTPIHVQLRNSLLFEMIGGGYKPQQRFLSNRKICRRWSVSDTTTRKALAWLVQNNILRARAQSGYFLRSGYHRRALLLLHKHTRTKLPTPPSLATKRFKYLGRTGRKQKRVGLVWFDEEMAAGVGRLPAKMMATGWDWSHGFFREAVAQGCEVHFFVHNFYQDQEKARIAEILAAELDGVAVFARSQYDQLPAMLETFSRANLPTVRVFGDNVGIEIPTVNLNNVAMGYEAGRRFLRLGHRRLMLLLEPVRQAYFEQRLEGFRMAVEERGEETSLEVFRIKPGVAAAVARSFEDPRNRPTAIFASRIEQYLMIGPILKANYLQVPADVSVIACGGTAQLPEMEQPVDSFIIDFCEVGRKAFQRLQETMAGNLKEKNTLVGVPLKRYGSTCKAPRHGLAGLASGASG